LLQRIFKLSRKQLNSRTEYQALLASQRGIYNYGLETGYLIDQLALAPSSTQVHFSLSLSLSLSLTRSLAHSFTNLWLIEMMIFGCIQLIGWKLLPHLSSPGCKNVINAIELPLPSGDVVATATLDLGAYYKISKIEWHTTQACQLAGAVLALDSPYDGNGVLLVPNRQVAGYFMSSPTINRVARFLKLRLSATHRKKANVNMIIAIRGDPISFTSAQALSASHTLLAQEVTPSSPPLSDLMDEIGMLHLVTRSLTHFIRTHHHHHHHQWYTRRPAIILQVVSRLDRSAALDLGTAVGSRGDAARQQRRRHHRRGIRLPHHAPGMRSTAVGVHHQPIDRVHYGLACPVADSLELRQGPDALSSPVRVRQSDSSQAYHAVVVGSPLHDTVSLARLDHYHFVDLVQISIYDLLEQYVSLSLSLSLSLSRDPHFAFTATTDRTAAACFPKHLVFAELTRVVEAMEEQQRARLASDCLRLLRSHLKETSSSSTPDQELLSWVAILLNKLLSTSSTLHHGMCFSSLLTHLTHDIISHSFISFTGARLQVPQLFSISNLWHSLSLCQLCQL